MIAGLPDRFGVETGRHVIRFAHIVRWFALAGLIGGIVGASTAFFIHLLNRSTISLTALPWHAWLAPVGLVASTWLVRTLAPDAAGHGTEKVIDAIHRRAGRIEARVVPIKLVATIATIATDGSAGKEGPCAQIGAGMASLLASLIGMPPAARIKLVTCGVSAGFAAVFGTPIAGALFGIEVLFVGAIQYEVMFPAFVAGIIGHQTAIALGVVHFHEALAPVQPFSQLVLLKFVLAGILFGLCAWLLIEGLQAGKSLAGRLRWPATATAAVDGGAIALIGLASGGRTLGLGTDVVNAALRGIPATPWDALGKVAATSLTLNFGGSGGVIFPIFFVGAATGSLAGGWLGIAPGALAGVGMVAVLAGAANTPIAASVMAAELFGPAIAPYAAIACIVSFLMTGYRSVYPSQIAAVAKDPATDARIGGSMDAIRPRTRRRPWTSAWSDRADGR